MGARLAVRRAGPADVALDDDPLVDRRPSRLVLQLLAAAQPAETGKPQINDPEGHRVATTIKATSSEINQT